MENENPFGCVSSGKNRSMQTNHDLSDDVPANFITGKALERYFELHDALREFSDLFRYDEKNDRAIAIVGAAFLDTLLEHSIVNFLVDDEKEVERLLEHDKPLGSYGNRVTAAYCFGLIPKTIRNDLRLVGKIRNRFAHDLRASFEDETIKAWCLSLKWHRISMFRDPPADVTVRDIFQVGVNQLVAYLNGVPSLAGMEKRSIPRE